MATPASRLLLGPLVNAGLCPVPYRNRFLRRLGVQLREPSWVFSGLKLRGDGPVTVGARSFLNHDVYLDTTAGIHLGDDVAIGARCMITTSDHRVGPHRRRSGPRRDGAVSVGDGSWIGAGSHILPGVTVGRGSIVGAGAVVTRDVPDDTVVAGVPAKPLRQLPADPG